MNETVDFLLRLTFLALIFGIYVKCSPAKADPAAFNCKYAGQDLIFTTDISPDTISIRRMFTYNDNETIHVFIPYISKDYTPAVVETEINGKAIKQQAECLYTN